VKHAARDYQAVGIAQIKQKLRERLRKPLYVLPTGGGKTFCYAMIAEGAAAKGNRVLILEHRKELIRQASVAVGRLGVRHQIIAPPSKIADIRRVHVDKIGWPMVSADSHVAVASVQTLARRMDWLAEYDPDIIVIDEAHHAVAGTWARIIEACPRSVLVGVTATPCRTDGQGLGDAFDCMVLGPSMADLIGEGYLVPFRVFVPPRKVDASTVRHEGGDLSTKAQSEILNTKQVTGDAVQHYRELAPGRPTIVFCCDIKHAEDVAQAFRDDGWLFEVVTGDMDDNLRDARIGGLETGALQGIVTVDIAGEGTDIPCAEVGIMLRLTESEGLFLQQAGRLTRTVYAPGFDLSTRDGRLGAIAASPKQFGLLIDHVGNVGVNTARGFIANHGFPDWDREWSLEGRKKTGKKKQEITERILQCPICQFVDVPRQICHGPKPGGGYCQHVFQVRSRQLDQVDGTLEEMSSDAGGMQVKKIQTGLARDIASLRDMGVGAQRAAHIIAARQEKERLQNELRDLLARWVADSGKTVQEGWGISVYQVRDMKPKALKEMIERVGEALFMCEGQSNGTG